MREDIKSIADLHFDPHNANLGTERGKQLLTESLEKYGAGRSIVCDRNGMVIGGNKTLEAAVNLGLDIATYHTSGDKLVVVIRDDLDLESNPKARELAYYDNRVAEVDLQWNIEQLQVDLSNGINLGSLWGADELASLQVTAPLEEKELNTESIDDIPESDKVEPRCKLGEIWQLGRHRILCGDSTDEQQVRRLLSDRKVDIVWADPPYGVNIVKVKERFGSVGAAKPFGSKDKRGSVGAGNACAVGLYAPIAGDNSIDIAFNSYTLCQTLVPGAVMFYWGGNYYAHRLPPTPCWIIWDKRDGMTSNNFADAEIAWTNQSTPARVFAHLWNGMIKASEKGDRRIHPTQKPVALAEWCFDKYGNLNDVVFDPFLGSGISIIAAEKIEGNRTVYGMELSPEYCEITMQRWEKLTGKVAQKL